MFAKQITFWGVLNGLEVVNPFRKQCELNECISCQEYDQQPTKAVVHLEGDMQLILLYYELHNSLVGCASLISQSFKNNKKVVYTLYQYIFLCVRPHVIIVEPN